MRRHIPLLIALMLLAGTAPLRAGNPPGREGSARLSCGIEWGYDATVIDAYHYNYMDAADGFRIDEEAVKPMLYSNGHAMAHLTVEFARRWALGLYAGYAGVQQRTRIFPLALRSTYFMESFRDDGQFLFLEGGAGLHETRRSISPFGRLGYGYRAVPAGAASTSRRRCASLPTIRPSTTVPSPATSPTRTSAAATPSTAPSSSPSP